MTDLEILSKFSSSDVEKAVQTYWKKESKFARRQAKKSRLFIVGGLRGSRTDIKAYEIYRNLYKDCVIIDYDKMRNLHPNAKKIYKKGAINSSDFFEYSDEFARQIYKNIVNKTLENGYNTVIVSDFYAEFQTQHFAKFEKYEKNLILLAGKKKNCDSGEAIRYYYEWVDFETKHSKKVPLKFPKSYLKNSSENFVPNCEKIVEKLDFKTIEIFYINLYLRKRLIFKDDKIDLNKIKEILNRAIFFKNAKKVVKI